MWHKAARALATYSEAVLNATDADGYPLSVRQTAPLSKYDPEHGTMPVVLPDALHPVEGPASLLAHYHNDKLWDLRAMLIKGRIERRGDGWTFVSTEYKPQSSWAMVTGAKRAAKQYLAKRGLGRPKIAFDVIRRLFREAQSIKDP